MSSLGRDTMEEGGEEAVAASYLTIIVIMPCSAWLTGVHILTNAN